MVCVLVNAKDVCNESWSHYWKWNVYLDDIAATQECQYTSAKLSAMRIRRNKTRGARLNVWGLLEWEDMFEIIESKMYVVPQYLNMLFLYKLAI